jgi:multiple sugar transport system permease protein
MTKVVKIYSKSDTVAFWAFLLPALTGLVAFTFIPLAWGVLLSLSHAQNTIHIGHFIGLRNYMDLLTDPAFLGSLVTIFVFALFIVPTTYVISLTLALLIQRTGRTSALFRTIIFIPTAVSYVGASLIWRVSLFNGTAYGFANHIIGIVGIPPIAWIGTTTPPWYWLVLVTVRLWLQIGFYMIIFLTALQEIPRSLYEAASIDGASDDWTVFRFITLPQLRVVSVSVVLLIMIAAFQAFDEFYNILGGGGMSLGNIGLARPPLVYLYNLALSNEDFGRGTAGGIILTIIIAALAFIQNRFTKHVESDQ